MTIELRMLIFSGILGILQLMAAAQASTQQRGMKWNFSPRDGKPPELTGTAARLDRAFKNFMETFPFFIAAVAVVQMANRLGPLSTLGAEIYFIARVVYVPLYILGIPVVRTLVWLTSMVGVALVIAACLMS
jgi:uncharacterized MAPEG superfamily protein